MKQYPSIPGSTGQEFREIPDAHIWDKLDGSNLRFEWSRKRGFHRQGTRERLFDETDPVFGPALPLFMETWAESLSRVFSDGRLESAIAFAEYHGPSSFAGSHVPGERMELTLFDVAVHRKGIIGPAEFLRTYVPLGGCAAYLGRANLTRGFVAQVHEGKIEGITFEGIVAKAGEGHHQLRAKAKTKAWLDRVHEVHGERAAAIINS